jgi:hypothetical protein
MYNCNIFLYHNLSKFMQVITSTKLVMKLKLVSLESGSSPLSNDAISVSIRCTVWKIFAFKTTPPKIVTFRPDENELRVNVSKNRTYEIFRGHKWKIDFAQILPRYTLLYRKMHHIYFRSNAFLTLRKCRFNTTTLNRHFVWENMHRFYRQISRRQPFLMDLKP